MTESDDDIVLGSSEADTARTSYEIVIERFADQGRCIAYIDGRVVFVRFALPGERVRVVLDEPTNRAGRFWTGEVAEVIEASPYRVTPPWKIAGPVAMGGGVGGADLIHVSLPEQLLWKKAVIQNQFQRLGGMRVDVDVHRIHGDIEADGLGWRTRIKLVADRDGFASMHQRESHKRIRISSMPLATKQLQELAEIERLWTRRFEPGAKIAIGVPYTGDSLEAVGENYAISVTSGGSKHQLSRHLSGSRQLIEYVHSPSLARTFKYRIDSNSFWQVHRLAPQTLLDVVLKYSEQALDGVRNPVVWDLYSGSGLFTIPLAYQAEMIGGSSRVMSVEGAPLAVEYARENIQHTGLENVEMIRGDVEWALRDVPQRFARPDCVVVDPPRVGIKAKVCDRIADSGTPYLIYISCDPTSLARDAKTLVARGFRLQEVAAYDIYPMTHHVETIAFFAK